MNEGLTKSVALGGALTALALYFVFQKGAPSVANKVLIPETTPRFHLFRSEDQGHGSLTATDRETGATLGEYVTDRAGRVHETPEQAASGRIKLTRTADYFALDPSLDLGAWAGYWNHGTASDSRSAPWQAGIRISPVRLAFDVVAPDAVLSADGLGAGLSIYPPASWSTRWCHIGVGAWYLVPFHRDDTPGWAIGLAFSTRSDE